MFLSDAELEALTGYARPRWQKVWLRQHGYPHEIDGQGRPRVLREFVQRRLGIKPKEDEANRPKLRLIESFVPDLSGFDLSLAKGCNLPVYKADRIKLITPKWADQGEIDRIYARCRYVTRRTGIKHHVDHIIPMTHPLVCGLHVPENLQIITASENSKKGNNFKPKDKP
jgi:5-methylcytosine-specific restriction endonuclease McrA